MSSSSDSTAPSAMAILRLTPEEVEQLIAAAERDGIGWETLVARLARQHLAGTTPPPPTPPWPTRPTPQEVRHALAVVAKAPPAVFLPSRERVSAYTSALGQLAAVVELLDTIGNVDDQALEAAGLLGDANLVDYAREAANDLRHAFAQLAEVVGGDDWHGVRERATQHARERADRDDEDGHRQLVETAAAIERRFPSKVKP